MIRSEYQNKNKKVPRKYQKRIQIIEKYSRLENFEK